jgi:3' terminal RNA ribose 2'-O-methyltransferase Hen1
MLLTITTTCPQASDLGYLLHKNPARVQSFELSFGKAHVFYPEAGDDRCTAALLLDVDPVWLVRGRRGPAGEGGTLEQYVNDRPYVASSLMSVAIAQVFGSALGGRSKDRQELANAPIPLAAKLAVVPCRAGEEFLRRLFEPLGYRVTAERHPLEPGFPEWGEGPYYTVTLEACCRLADLLGHLYVLIPVLDGSKHYWVGDDEMEKLLRHGQGWLAGHPEKEAIARRYLKHRHGLVRQALDKLTVEETPELEEDETRRQQEEAEVERPLSLNTQRLGTVMAVLRSEGVKRVLDLGCGEGHLLKLLLDDRQFEQIVGLDVSSRALEIAADRLHLDRLPERKRERIKLLHGALTYRDARLAGFEAATVIEVIEHLDPPRLAAFERVLFECARPGLVVLTTPNAEYNAKWPSLPAGRFRHRDHRFEWTRAEFQAWANGVAERLKYAVRFLPVGPEDAEVGPPTQMAVFVIQE